MDRHWKIARRTLPLDRPLVMGILNVTPDSFSDGGRYLHLTDALRQIEKMVSDGADMIDIGGESTRPGKDRSRVSDEIEIERVVPVIEAASSRWDTPISIDTTKRRVAMAAIEAGAEIINDISGLRWEPELADISARTGAGLIIMHSRGEFESLHTQPQIEDMMSHVKATFRNSIALAQSRGVGAEQISLDVGIGFGKTPEQNLDLILNVADLAREFHGYPIVVGASRKSFISKLLRRDIPPPARLAASLTAAVLAVERGAKILRVHDVAETRQAIDLLSVASGIPS